MEVSRLEELQEDNLINNTYLNIYFHNYQRIDINTLKLNHHDLVIGYYYLLIEKTNNDDLVYLVKLTYYNKLKIYSPINITNNTYYLNRIYPCFINKNLEFTLASLQIYQVENILDINQHDLYIIYYKYKILYMPTRKSNFIINSFICIMCSGHTYYYSIKYLKLCNSKNK